MDWLASHVGAALSVTTVLAGAAGWVSHHLGLFAEKAIDLEVVKGLDAVKNPKLKAILVKVDQAVDSEIPGAGDAKYDMLTALIMTALPAEAAPAKPLLARPVSLATLRGAATPQLLKNPHIVDVFFNMIYTMEYEVAQSRLEMAHVVLHPDLKGFSWTELHRAGEIIKAGERAAEEALPRIKALIPSLRPTA